MAGPKLTALRIKTLSHIRRINDEGNCAARCPYAEMIEDADAAILEGLSEWKTDRFGMGGRFITDQGRAALTENGRDG